MSGYLVSPDGSDLRRIDADVWIEYPSFSPDGARIAFMGHDGGDYDVYVADLATGTASRLTEAPRSDGWPAWSPDGSTIAFASGTRRLPKHRGRSHRVGLILRARPASITTSGSWMSTARTSVA